MTPNASSPLSGRIGRALLRPLTAVFRRADAVQVRNFFFLFASCIEEEVVRRNESGSDIGEQLEYEHRSDGNVVVTHHRFPALELKLWAEEEAKLIRYSYTGKSESESRPQQSSSGQFRILEIRGNGLALLTGELLLSFEDATRLLLEPFVS